MNLYIVVVVVVVVAVVVVVVVVVIAINLGCMPAVRQKHTLLLKIKNLWSWFCCDESAQ
jgi:hypothetical protein